MAPKIQTRRVEKEPMWCRHEDDKKSNDYMSVSYMFIFSFHKYDTCDLQMTITGIISARDGLCSNHVTTISISLNEMRKLISSSKQTAVTVCGRFPVSTQQLATVIIIFNITHTLQIPFHTTKYILRRAQQCLFDYTTHSQNIEDIRWSKQLSVVDLLFERLNIENINKVGFQSVDGLSGLS